MFREPRLSRIAAFLSSIGIATGPGPVDVPTAFPARSFGAARGRDEDKLLSPGAVLHEAAHIAAARPSVALPTSRF